MGFAVGYIVRGDTHVVGKTSGKIGFQPLEARQLSRPGDEHTLYAVAYQRADHPVGTRYNGHLRQFIEITCLAGIKFGTLLHRGLAAESALEKHVDGFGAGHTFVEVKLLGGACNPES